MLKFFKTALTIVGKLSLLTFLVGVISAKGPEIHSAYIRSYVGSKVVLVTAPGIPGRGGTGFFVQANSGKTFILTNAHVCELNTNGAVDIILPEEDLTVKRQIIEIYKNHDLCLVESVVNYSGLNIAGSMPVGTVIGLLGHPKLNPMSLFKGEYIGDRSIQLVHSINSTKKKCPGNLVKPKGFAGLFVKNFCVVDRYSSQITAYSRGGSSGSPVVNFWGNIVGVLFAGDRNDPFESFAVPLTEIKEFLSRY